MNRAALLLIPATVLVAGACTSNVEDRRVQIYELQRDGSDESVARIREALEDEHGDVRATALHALVTMEVPDAEELAIRGLDDPDGFVRKIAARGAAKLGASRAVPILAERVRTDENWRVRETAAESLTTLGGADVTEVLIDVLDDPVKEVRIAAVRGITRIAPEAAIDEFAVMVLDDPDWEIRVQVAAVLGKSGREDVVPALEQAADDPNEFVRAAVQGALQAGD